MIWKFIGNKVKEAGNEAEVVGSGQSKLSFPAKGSGSPRGTSRKVRAVGREDGGASLQVGKRQLEGKEGWRKIFRHLLTLGMKIMENTIIVTNVPRSPAREGTDYVEKDCDVVQF